MPTPDLALIGDNSDHIVRVFPGEIKVAVVQRPSHVLGVFLVYAENDGLAPAVRLVEKLGEIVGDGFGAPLERQAALKIAGPVFPVRDFAAITVKLALGGTPARRVHGGHDAVDAVRGKKAIVNALAQAVSVKRVAEILVSVAVVFAERRGRHAELVGGLEVVQDLAPVAFIAGAAAVAFVNDNQVKKVVGKVTEKSRCVFAAGDGLVSGKIHFPALDGLAFDLPAGVPKGRENVVLRIVHQDVAIRQVEDARAPIRAGAVPARVPEFPANLKSNDGLARARGESQQDARLPLQDGLDRPVDGDLLVVTGRLAGKVVVGGEQPGGDFVRDAFLAAQAAPQVGWRGKSLKLGVGARQEVVLDDAFAIGCIRELKPKDVRVLFGLLKPVRRSPVGCLGLNDREREIPGVAEQIVRPLLRPPRYPGAGDDDATVRKRLLLADLVLRPARRMKLRDDVSATGVGFVQGCHRQARSGRWGPWGSILATRSWGSMIAGMPLWMSALRRKGTLILHSETAKKAGRWGYSGTTNRPGMRWKWRTLTTALLFSVELAGQQRDAEVFEESSSAEQAGRYERVPGLGVRGSQKATRLDLLPF